MLSTRVTFAVLICAVPSLAQQAYLDKLSAGPGETVHVHLASTASDIEVYRTVDFGVEELRLAAGPFPVPTQTWTPGSYAHVPSDPALEITGQISLEAWVRPVVSGDGRSYGILSKYSVPGETAYSIYLISSGELAFYLGDTGVFSRTNRTLSSQPVRVHEWTHIVATYDGQEKRVYINGVLDVTEARTGAIYDTSEPVRVAAFGSNGAASSFFNGQIDSPVIYNRALSAAEVAQRFAERADYTAANPGVLAGAVAQWNFAELAGETLGDATGNGRDLTLVNNGCRGVPGPSPRLDPTGSHSIRFSEEDLFDLDWPSPFSFTIPATWESGLYHVKISGQGIPLIVKPAPAARRRIAVIVSSNTWHAYNGWSGNDLYSNHVGGPISYYVNMRQPNPAVFVNVHTPGGTYDHLLGAERYLYRWLDDNGYPFDLYNDLDLHRDPNLLDSYDVLMLNGHSEYWTTEMVDHLEAFQAKGGSVVNLSGNTMWSRVTYNDDFTVMEGRKFPHSNGTIPADERWHSQDGGVLGGTMRCVGRIEPAILGTGHGVFTSIANFGWGRVLLDKHWIMQGTGLTVGDRFGESSLNGDGMFGHETDVIFEQWSPPGLLILARAVYPPEANATSFTINNCQSRSFVPVSQGGDVVYFDHPGGGGVFGIPSIAAGGSLAVDLAASRMLNNVMTHFLTIPKCRFRNGTGVNPPDFACTTLPILGTTWQGTIAMQPNTLLTIVAVGFAGGHPGFPMQGGELLIKPFPPPRLLDGLGTHTIPLPPGPFGAGLAISTQGLRLDDIGGTPTLVLLNALDMVLGL